MNYHATDGTIALDIEQDQCCEDPREGCDGWLGTMYCWHRRYILGDDQPELDPRRWIHEFQRGRKVKDFALLPLYLYDHSGITMNTTGFHCPWDSGQVGYIIATRQRAEELGIAWDPETIADQLRTEVEVYDAYLRGDVWYYMLKEFRAGEWHEFDSCGGFFGTNWQGNGMADCLGEHRALLNILREVLGC